MDQVTGPRMHRCTSSTTSLSFSPRRTRLPLPRLHIASFSRGYFAATRRVLDAGEESNIFMYFLDVGEATQRHPTPAGRLTTEGCAIWERNTDGKQSFRSFWYHQ